MTRVRWGIIGPGRIADKFALGLAHSRLGALAAVASRSQEGADAFARDHSAGRAYGSYDALLADPDVQAVYVATPHPMHAEWSIKAARAGKAVLCEKPIAMSGAEAETIIRAADDAGVFLMEAYMYRCAPQTARLIDLVRAGTVGQVRMVRAAFSYHAQFKPDSRAYDKQLGGGGILDVGGYPVSMCRLIAGVADGGQLAEPTGFNGFVHVGPTGVDEWAAATMLFPGDIIAQVSCGVAVTQDNPVQVFGSEGSITVPWPWIPARESGATKILLKLHSEPAAREIMVETDEWLYGLEADAGAKAIMAGRKEADWPAMTWADTLGNMRALDRWRQV